LSGEESGLDDDWLSWESSLTEDLEESTFGDVNDWSDGGILSSIDSGFFGDERPDLVNVDGAKKYKIRIGFRPSSMPCTL